MVLRMYWEYWKLFGIASTCSMSGTTAELLTPMQTANSIEYGQYPRYRNPKIQAPTVQNPEVLRVLAM